jgi:hypothetical protein
VQNHDAERGNSTLNYKDPNNVIANEFMLAWPHGVRRANGTCTGPTVTVGSGGRATITVGSCDAVAFTARDRV